MHATASAAVTAKLPHVQRIASNALGSSGDAARAGKCCVLEVLSHRRRCTASGSCNAGHVAIEGGGLV